MKTNKTNKKIHHRLIFWLGVVVIGAALGVVVQFTRAWVEPSANAPGGNIAAPINTGATPQTKVGNPAVTGVPADICVDPNGDGNKKCLSSGGSGGGGGIYQAVRQGGCPSCEPGYHAVKCEQIGQFNIGVYYISYYATLCSYLGADSCSAAGGTLLQDGTTSFCQFSGSSCPSGWSKYKNWTETTPVSCSGNQGGSPSCPPSPANPKSTGSHSWSNYAGSSESFLYYDGARIITPAIDGPASCAACEGGPAFYRDGASCASYPGDYLLCPATEGNSDGWIYCYDPYNSDNPMVSYVCAHDQNYCGTANQRTCSPTITKIGCY